jgi:hypothetical protein
MYSNQIGTLESISIDPTYDIYFVGQEIDPNRFSVTGHYSDGFESRESITTNNISGFDSSQVTNNQVITIDVGGKTATSSIDIVNPIYSISQNSIPNDRDIYIDEISGEGFEEGQSVSLYNPTTQTSVSCSGFTIASSTIITGTTCSTTGADIGYWNVVVDDNGLKAIMFDGLYISDGSYVMPTDNLIAYYKFNEGANPVIDYSGNGNSGELYGSAYYGNGLEGNGIETYEKGWLETRVNSDYSGNEFSISAKVKIDDFDSNRMVWRLEGDYTGFSVVTADIYNNNLSFNIENYLNPESKATSTILSTPLSNDELTALANIPEGISYDIDTRLFTLDSRANLSEYGINNILNDGDSPFSTDHKNEIQPLWTEVYNKTAFDLAVDLSNSSSSFNLGSFNSIVFTINGNSYKVYINGNEVASSSDGLVSFEMDLSNYDQPARFSAMSTDWNDKWLIGKMDEVMIYTRELSSEEAASISIGLGVFESIEITNPINRDVYIKGETIDLTGLEVTRHYSDGLNFVENITENNISGFDSSMAVNDQLVTVNVENKTTNFLVSIFNPIYYISQNSIPNDRDIYIDFIVGEGFEEEGTTTVVLYNVNTQETLTCSGFTVASSTVITGVTCPTINKDIGYWNVTVINPSGIRAISFDGLYVSDGSYQLATSSLIAYHKFNDEADPITDYSGNNSTGSLEGDIIYTGVKRRGCT